MSNERPKKPGFYFVDTAERHDTHSHVVQVRDDGEVFVIGVQGAINWPPHMLRNWRPAVDYDVLRKGSENTTGVAVRLRDDEIYVLLPNGSKPFGKICVNDREPRAVAEVVARQVQTVLQCLLEHREVDTDRMAVDLLTEQVCTFLGVGGAAVMTMLQIWKSDLEKYDKLRRALREMGKAKIEDPELAALVAELQEQL